MNTSNISRVIQMNFSGCFSLCLPRNMHFAQHCIKSSAFRLLVFMIWLRIFFRLPLLIGLFYLVFGSFAVVSDLVIFIAKYFQKLSPRDSITLSCQTYQIIKFQ